MSGRWICRAAGHPYHEVSSPPRVAGVCDLDGSELYQRADDQPETIRARMDQQLGALGQVIEHYRASGVLRTVDGLQSIEAVAAAIDSALTDAGVDGGGLMEITRKSAAEIAKMRVAGRIVAEVLALVEESLAPGISTAELDRMAERHIRASGGIPSFLGYLGGRRYDMSHPHAYKASTCISIDHEIVHGIPGNREIKRGAMVSVDVGAIYDGWNGDGARTFICGGREAGSAEALALMDATRLALMAGIAAAQPGTAWRTSAPRSRPSAARAATASSAATAGTASGSSMHEDPSVLNFATDFPDARVRLEPGMCLAIEPMFMAGGERTKTLKDGWTVVTADHSLAAHFEHTIAITSDGPRDPDEGLGPVLSDRAGV